jgi:phospholipid transport system substrate-binding protein
MPQLRRAASFLATALLLMVPLASARSESENVIPAPPAVVGPIEALDQGLIEIMKAGRGTPFQQRAATLAPVIERALDLPEILKFSVGLGWSSLTPEQQTTLLAAFRRYTIASYVDNFDNYNGQRFTIDPTVRVLPDRREVVSTRIIPQTGTPHTLDYIMHRTPDGWKVVDVLADGSISRVAVQRSDFNATFSRGGAPALEASLQEKTEALSHG